MNQHARDIEPDLGPLLDITDDLPDQDAFGSGKTEPRLDDNTKKKPGLTLGPMDRIGPMSAPPSERSPKRVPKAAAHPAPGLWGGFWRAVVIGIVSGIVGGLVGAFTLVWLTGEGWSVLAKLLVDAIGHL
ncbi:hypothetical protein [Pleomorphomonas sp. JP5]|uniref:hypothetical protein n=1 Tax=Pleomorphomonas sp. JP5 TaxID=2942998 RepID=UPI002043888E|nr:hypothetical protein [Pleomorphomonas sp. JP5]MCM5559221.1 hypothetical protein [Pleomorphomonas sp. JP5]